MTASALKIRKAVWLSVFEADYGNASTLHHTAFHQFLITEITSYVHSDEMREALKQRHR